MKEDGIDISDYTSNNVNEYADMKFDCVITVCDNAKENCPYFPATVKTLHHNFPYPAKAKGTDEEIMKSLRDVREMIKVYTRDFVSQP